MRRVVWCGVASNDMGGITSSWPFVVLSFDLSTREITSRDPGRDRNEFARETEAALLLN